MFKKVFNHFKAQPKAHKKEVRRLFPTLDSPTKPLPTIHTVVRHQDVSKGGLFGIMHRASKDAVRSGVIAFFVTLLVIAFFGGTSAAIYNTAAVLYGKDAVVSVDKNETSVQFTWMDDTISLPAETAERAVELAAACAAWLPGNIRCAILGAGGFHALTFAFWNWAGPLLQ